ncbi:24299_t:CDS:2, partial [Cetraspora pellucida]
MSLNQNKYPENNPFMFKQSNTNYNYHIINKGFYPSNSKIYYTSARSHSGTKYKIPDNYLVQTSWGRGKSQHIIEYEIEYDSDGPVFRIRFNENSQHYVIESKESSTAVANNYLQDISLTTTNETPHISNQDIEEEISQYICKADYRRVNDILLFIIPDIVARNVLNVNNPVINVHISGDGCNVGRKIKHVMITCTILDDISNIHKADLHYTIILYLGGENYEMLQKKIKLYFSSDWKFMAIMLGFNAPNATYFCPWCLCTKKEIGNKDKMYKIEKNINQLKSEFFNDRISQTLNLPPLGHLKVPLLPMISLNHYVPDELHIMLRIWDRLWELVIQELKSENRFDNHVRAIINVEMQKISVDDKEKVLCDFNFEVIFDEEQAILINHLWRDFYTLYKLIKDRETDPTFFI